MALQFSPAPINSDDEAEVGRKKCAKSGLREGERSSGRSASGIGQAAEPGASKHASLTLCLLGGAWVTRLEWAQPTTARSALGEREGPMRCRAVRQITCGLVPHALSLGAGGREGLDPGSPSSHSLLCNAASAIEAVVASGCSLDV